MLLFYIRHGDPIYNPDMLTPLGKRQADAIAKRLSLYGIDKIYSSTSNRAIETAEPTCEILKKEKTLLDFANEKHAFADFSLPQPDGRNHWIWETAEIIEKFSNKEVVSLGMKWYTHPTFNGYNFKAGFERIENETDKFISSLGYTRDAETGIYKATPGNDDRVALFAHAGFGFLFLSYILNIPYPIFCTHFNMCHTGMSVIEFKQLHGRVSPSLLTYSSDSHLYKEGLPTKYNNNIYF